MTTLHALRRRHNVSLSDLARMTGIPVRRLAEYEYEARPLQAYEREVIAALFRVRVQQVSSGLSPLVPARERAMRQPEQAYLFAALAATAALSLSLRLSGPATSFDWIGGISAEPASVAAVEPAVAPAVTVAPTQTTVAPTQTTVAPTQTPSPVAEVVVASTPVVPSATPAPTAGPTATPAPAGPHRCPVETDSGAVVVMAGYSAGTHTPGATNGAVDLAVDSDGNGFAEPWATRGAQVVATHAGIATVELDSWPGGNYVSIEGGEGWRSRYSHLQKVYVQSGQRVEAGEPLGEIGNTGQAGGPHLDIKVWLNGNNVDPTEMLHCR